MTVVINMPTYFDEFEKKKALISNASVKQLLNRFAYRYRLARSFEGMNAPAVGKTLEGYDAILKLLLAYTAYEVILKAANKLHVPNVKPMNENQINNAELVERIGKNEGLKSFLLSNTSHKNVVIALQSAFKGECADIACIAFALRNLFAHGDLTPSRIGLVNKRERKILWDIADAILTYCDGVFTSCIESDQLSVKGKNH